ncbi:Protein of unknown function [Propionibacterium freudenreichii]|nr:Protein of unknown function [Propionibacterium freudenreichii]
MRSERDVVPRTAEPI